MHTFNRLLTVHPAVANVMLVALSALAVFALIRYLRGLSTEERWEVLKLLRTILLFPLVVFWVVATSQSHHCNCPQCRRQD